MSKDSNNNPNGMFKATNPNAMFKVTLSYDAVIFIPATNEGLAIVKAIAASVVYKTMGLWGDCNGKRVDYYFTPSGSKIKIEFMVSEPVISDEELVEDVHIERQEAA